jgi:acetate---CoA ligase (ADP-forming)
VVKDLNSLLKPRSIAVLGASERPSVGRALIESLGILGFQGSILPINPKYKTVLGVDCHASLSDLTEPPDLVAFCVNNQRTIENFRLLPECGAKAAVIYNGGFAESCENGQLFQDELVAICKESKIALLGPNCMGSLSPWHRSTTYMAKAREVPGIAGNVGFVSQSGSICIGMLTDLRRFGFSYVLRLKLFDFKSPNLFEHKKMLPEAQ